MVYMDFHERLQAILDSKNLKQVSLAELTGLSSAQVNHLVSGRTKDPKLETVVKIANALDISLDYLAGRREDPAPRLTRDEAVLISDYRDCTPERQRKAAEAVRDQRVLSQGQEAAGESSDDEQPESMNMLDFLMQSASKNGEEGAA